MSDRMTAEQEEKMRAGFEADYLGGNKKLAHRCSTTGDYAIPAIRDAFAGWQAATLAAQARTAEVVERALNALETARFAMYGIGPGNPRMDASITELQQHLGKKQ